MRRVPDAPRTRVEEMLRARGLTQSEVVARTGWYPSTISKIVVGHSQLTAHSSAVLARLCSCAVADLYAPIAAPIPPPNTNWVGMDAGEEFEDRVRVILRLLDVPSLVGLFRFIAAGDLSALPPHVAQRFRRFLDERPIPRAPLDDVTAAASPAIEKQPVRNNNQRQTTMIKAKGIGPDGRPTYWIGLSFGNLDKFKAEPLDTFIMIRKEESGLDHDIMLFSGRTEREMADLVAKGMGPDSKVTIRRVKV